MKKILAALLLPVLLFGFGCQSTSELLQSATSGLTSIIPGNGIHSAAAKGDIKGIKAIVAEKGQEAINQRDKIGNTPLMMAAYKGQAKTVEYLLENGANPKLTNKDGETVFHAAAQGNQPAVFMALQITHGKLANKTNYNQVTPYMMGAYSGIGEAFFHKVSDNMFFAKDADGADLLSWAVAGGNHSLVSYYGTRAGSNLNIDKLRKAYLDNFDNPKSKQSLAMVSELYCRHALSTPSFKPQSLDKMKFGRQCSYDFSQLYQQRVGE